LGAVVTEEPQPTARVRLPLIVALVAALVLLCCGGGVVSYLVGGLDGEEDFSASGCGREAIVDPNDDLPRVAGLSDEQMHNAAVIIRTGQQMQVPPRGWVIAIGTALQESYLRNLPHLGNRNDHDSLGLFQQRPSQGWGTTDQILNPEYSSRKFYEKLVLVNNWLIIALTDAAQAVQRSAFPDAYAKHEPMATAIVNALTGGAARAVGNVTDLRCVAGIGEIAASGWTIPLRGAITSGFRTLSRPSHHGVDIGVPKGTVIRAAAAGIVLKVRCNAIAPNGSDWGCNRDGSPRVRGCGWYVDMLHAGGIVTRYCHMIARPSVTVGQSVAPGQELGRSGSSGNSSGPHLHFEVHRDGDPTRNGAIDPVRFMIEVGAPLGTEP
jgi:murein DD-endopeptidase MepM/ murein hydrolase activator NlpD